MQPIQQVPLDLALTFEGKPIHAFLHGNKPAWLASEVGNLLDIQRPNNVLSQSKLVERGTDWDVLPASVVGASTIYGLAPTTDKVTVLFESGLYAFVLRSNKPAAIRFTRWVIREVLPTLREQGLYAMLPQEFQGDAFSTAQLIKLIELAGKGNAWAERILTAKGLHPAAEGGAHE